MIEINSENTDFLLNCAQKNIDIQRNLDRKKLDLQGNLDSYKDGILLEMLLVQEVHNQKTTTIQTDLAVYKDSLFTKL